MKSHVDAGRHSRGGDDIRRLPVVDEANAADDVRAATLGQLLQIADVGAVGCGLQSIEHVSLRRDQGTDANGRQYFHFRALARNPIDPGWISLLELKHEVRRPTRD